MKLPEPMVPGLEGTGTVKVGDVAIGAGIPKIIAGPCAVESLEQLLSAARYAKAGGAHILRAGVYKPRSSPYSFQGLGYPGLEIIKAVREETGLPVVTEITSSDQLDALMEYVDMIQIGARNMQNFELLKAVGRQSKPILLKRGASATIEEWIMAAEYIALGGNRNIVLCERGIRTYETYTRNTLDLSAVAAVKTLSCMPVIVDPSHGTGRPELIVPMSKAALAAGADGIMVEMHPSPEDALSDGHQSLSPRQFQFLMDAISQDHHNITGYPDIDSFITLASCHDIVPITTDLHSDTITSAQGYLALGKPGESFLLESVQGGDRLGRYSFIGIDPLAILTVKGSETVMDDRSGLFGEPGIRNMSGNPLLELKSLFNSIRCHVSPDLPRFFGGAVGYLAYDVARNIESLPEPAPDDLGLPDSILLFPGIVLAFDHVSNRIKLVCNAVTRGKDPKQAYHKAIADLERVTGLLSSTPRAKEPTSRGTDTPVSPRVSMTMEEYMTAVAKAKEHILAGDVFQVVLSQRYTMPFHGDPFDLYRKLRSINPSPYTFFLNLPGMCLVGSSPEILVRLENGRAELRPIAGTRKRGCNPEEDSRLATELLTDPKERAEHIMLVDLGRNDLGRVCRYGSVKVSDLMSIERYSHVMHIASGCSGELAEGKDQFDLLMAAFPAGTLTGAPKVEAMRIIGELEPVKRGPYGGVVGYFGWDGNMDTCITIRTAVISEGEVHVQAGAGIVADSVPALEHMECVNKAKALLSCLDTELPMGSGGVE